MTVFKKRKFSERHASTPDDANATRTTRNFWSSAYVLGPSDYFPNETGKPSNTTSNQTSTPLNVLFIGARGSGITTLMASLLEWRQGMFFDTQKVKYQSTQISEQLRRAPLAGKEFFKEPALSGLPIGYSLQFKLEPNHILGIESRDLKIFVKDGATEDPFPDSVCPDWLPDSQNWGDYPSISRLILCMDIENPRSVLWRAYLHCVCDQIRSLRQGSQKNREPFDILILLTKADRLIQQQQKDTAGYSFRDITGTLTAKDIADRIDLLSLAQEIIGVSALKQICGCLDGGRQLSIGLVSAHGFAPPGVEIYPDAENWSPYGLYALFDFLINGQASQNPIWNTDNIRLDQGNEIELCLSAKH